MPRPTMLPNPLFSGQPSTDGTKRGRVVLSQRATITQNSTTAVTATFTLPKGRIVDILFDVTTAYNSGTSATGTVGSAAAGTQYAGAVDCKTAGRARPTFSAAQLAAHVLTGAENSVYATVTPSGATSAGVVLVTIVYEADE